MTGAGARRHRVTLQIPGAAVPDGDGAYTQTWTDLAPPSVFAAIAPATAKDLEHVAAGTVLSAETLIVTVPFHAGLTTKARLTWTDPVGRAHVANITGVTNPDGRCRELALVCVEVVP